MGNEGLAEQRSEGTGLLDLHLNAELSSAKDNVCWFHVVRVLCHVTQPYSIINSSGTPPSPSASHLQSCWWSVRTNAVFFAQMRGGGGGGGFSVTWVCSVFKWKVQAGLLFIRTCICNTGHFCLWTLFVPPPVLSLPVGGAPPVWSGVSLMQLSALWPRFHLL